jgi:hypothetical protein
MQTFRQYLDESVKRLDTDFVDLSIDSTQTPKNDLSIPTFQPSKLRSTADKTKTLGNRVFYAYPYSSSEEITNLLKTIKSKGPYKLDQPKLDLFIGKTAAYMAESLKGKFDVILCPNSSSYVAKRFAQKLGQQLDVEVIYDAFDKLKINLPEKREDAIKYVMDNFIDKRRFAETFKAKDQQTFDTNLRKLALGIVNSIRRVGKLELKLLYKPTAKFAANFMKAEVHTKHRLLEKRVLVVDDSFSSGGTMMEIFRQALDSMGAASVSGAVIFMQKS